MGPTGGKRTGLAAINSCTQTEPIGFVENFNQLQQPRAKKSSAPRNKDVLSPQAAQSVTATIENSFSIRANKG
jgi:hypothetical protein